MIVAFQRDITHLRGIGLNADALLFEGEFGQCSADASADGDTCRRTSAAAMVADTVFLLIGEVGMRGTEHVAHVLVIL